MRKDVEKQFEDLSLQTVQKAERIRCDFEEFVDGLEDLWKNIHGRWIDAKSELEQMEDG